MRLAVAAASIALAVSTSAHAQFTAQVVTTLTDPGSGVPMTSALPGQTIRVRTTVSWNETPGVTTQMAGIAGDQLATPAGFGGVGAPSNLFSEYTAGGLVNLGSFQGDDVIGVDIAVVPAFFTGGFMIPPSFNHAGIEFIGYDWTVPNEIGIYDFEFRAAAAAPNFRLFPTMTSPAFVEVPTTYTGARLFVIPAPATLTALALLAIPRRSRR